MLVLPLFAGTEVLVSSLLPQFQFRHFCGLKKSQAIAMPNSPQATPKEQLTMHTRQVTSLTACCRSP